MHGVHVGTVSTPTFVSTFPWLTLRGRFHGGWLAPNIYYLGASGSIHVQPTTSSPSPGPGIRIAGLSGIYKSHDYPRGHWERVPFDAGSVKSAYHVREYDVLKLKQVRTLFARPGSGGLMRGQLRRRKGGEVDLFMSHDWPVTITRHGDERRLLQQKPFFRDEVRSFFPFPRSRSWADRLASVQR